MQDEHFWDDVLGVITCAWSDGRLSQEDYDLYYEGVKRRAQALADMRTLDEATGGRWRMCRFAAVLPGEVKAHGCWIESASVRHFFADAEPGKPCGTPEAARAKAAACVREQKR